MGTRLYVGGLPPDVKEQEVSDVLKPLVEVADVYIAREKAPTETKETRPAVLRSCRGYAFAQVMAYAPGTTLKQCLGALNGMLLRGQHRLNVSVAKEDPLRRIWVGSKESGNTTRADPLSKRKNSIRIRQPHAKKLLRVDLRVPPGTFQSLKPALGGMDTSSSSDSSDSSSSSDVSGESASTTRDFNESGASSDVNAARPSSSGTLPPKPDPDAGHSLGDMFGAAANTAMPFRFSLLGEDHDDASWGSQQHQSEPTGASAAALPQLLSHVPDAHLPHGHAAPSGTGFPPILSFVCAWGGGGPLRRELVSWLGPPNHHSLAFHDGQPLRDVDERIWETQLPMLRRSFKERRKQAHRTQRRRESRPHGRA